jgi:transcriptional regulator with XRE-family HTH domain
MADNQQLSRFIEEIRYRENINQTQIAERIGVTANYFSDVKKCRADLTDELLDKIYGVFPYLKNLEMDKKQKKKEPLYIPSNAVPTVEAVEFEYAGENHNGGIFYRDKNSGKLYLSVPHVPYAARGEFPNLADSLEPTTEWGRETYEVDKKVNGRYFSFDVRGDSMDNGMRKSLQDGDKVLVRELELDNWRTLRAGDHRFWVLVFDSSVLIKEISSFDGDTGTIICHSLNPSPEYHDFTLSLDNVRYLYYVIKIKPHEIDTF